MLHHGYMHYTPQLSVYRPIILGSLMRSIHSKKFLHGKIFICMLHRGHLQENIAEFLICTQLGLIRDVTSLVNEITYL